MNRHLLISWVLVLLSLQVFGQNQANVWMFGINAGIDFNTTPPTAINNSALVSQEGSAVMCNPGGQLLFYTNGETIWDRSNTPMPNGQFLLGRKSTTQSAVIVPHPDQKNRYYVFALDEQGGPNGLTYSEVDMSLNGGKGDIVPSSKNILLQQTLTEKLTAIRHRNGTDYWVLVHGINDKKFYAYKVTSSGPASTAVISDIGSLHPNAGGTGYLKFSPNGKKAACAVGGTGSFIELFDFDDESGELANPMRIDFTTDKPYGIEFSPNSKYLYVSAGNTIYQYEIPEIKNSTLLTISQKPIAADAGVWSLQLAHNNKMYVCKHSNKIGVINKPNNEASTVDFQDNAVLLNGRTAVQGLPNFMGHLFSDNFIIAENTCAMQPTLFRLALNEVDSIHWELTETNGTAIISKVGFAPTYTFLLPGLYNIKATMYSGNYTEIFAKTIKVEGLPQYTLGNDTTLCKGQSIKFDFSIPAATYKWSNGKAGGKYLITTPGSHFVDVTLQGCTVRDSINIAYDLIQASFTANSTSQCFDKNAFEFTSNAVNASTAYWFIDAATKGSGKQLTYSFANTGTYQISHTVTSALGCSDSIGKEIKVLDSPKALFTVTAINNCGNNNRFKIENATTYAGVYTFEVNTDGRTYRNISPLEISFPTPGDYTIKFLVKTSDGCEDFVEKKITVFHAPNATFNVIGTNQCLDNNNFDIVFERPLKSYEKLNWQIDGKAFLPASTHFSYSFSTAGTHTINAELNNTSGCKIAYSQQVEVFENPTTDFSTNTGNQYCLGNSAIQFNNNSKSNLAITSYLWQFGDNTEATQENPTHQYTKEDQYLISLITTNEKGCQSSASKTISTFEQPEIEIVVNTKNQCEGNNAFEISYTNTNPTASIAQLVWSNPSGSAILPQSPAMINFATTGEHTISLEATSIFGCKDIATTTIKVYPNPTGDLVANTSEQCLNSNTLFELTAPISHNGIANTDFVWDFDNGNGNSMLNTASVSFKDAKEYYIQVQVTDENGCSNTFDKKLIVNPIPVFNLTHVEGCAGTPVKLKVKTDNNFIPLVQWDWDLGDGNFSKTAQPNHIYNAEGNYTLSAIAASDKGCLYTATLTNGAQIAPIPVISFESEKTYWGFDETELKFTAIATIPVNTWAWSFGNGKKGTQPQENIKFKEAGYYTVNLVGTSDKGCTAGITKSVLIVPPFDAYVPTSFTPNGDGINDFFGMEGVEFISSYKMQIFNRWGQELFSTINLKIMWDGRYNNTTMPGDMYTYVINITDIDNRLYKLNGTVQLIR